MKLKRPATTAVALVTSLSVSGCSFIFSEGPPPNHQRLPYFDCSTSYAPPVLDTIWGGLNGLGAMVAMSSSDAEWQMDGQSGDRSTVIGVGLVWLAVSGASAIYGYSKVGQCRQAKDQLMLRMMRPAAPQAWPPPPPGYPAPPPGYPAPPPGYPAPPPGYPAPPPGYPPPATPSTPPGQPTPAPAPAPQTPAPAPAPKTPPATTPAPVPKTPPATTP